MQTSDTYFTRCKMKRLHLALAVSALFLSYTESTAQKIKADTVTYRIAVGKVADFDDDGTDDTLFYSLQDLVVKGREDRTRTFPYCIVWGDTLASAKSHDSTTFTIPKDEETEIAFSIRDVNNDGIVDIELMYLWETKSAKGERNHANKVWTVTSGPDLRLEKIVVLDDAKVALKKEAGPLKESTDSRGSERPLGIGGMSIRKIGGDSRSAKKHIDSKPPPEFQTSEADILVFPNPADKIVNINCPLTDESSQLVIVDAVGRQIIVENLKRGISTKQIDISWLVSGRYAVRIDYLDGRRLSSALVVKH